MENCVALEFALTSGEDVDATKQVLLRAFHTTVASAHEHASAMLKAAAAVLDVAMDGGACASAYTNYANVRRYETLANDMLASALDIGNLLIALNENEDPAITQAYSQHLVDMSRATEIMAILSGANERLGAANRALPDDPIPGARFNTAVFAQGAPQET